VIAYSDKIGAFFGISDLRSSIESALKDEFVESNFDKIPITSIVDSLSVPAKIDLREFNVNYLQIVRTRRRKRVSCLMTQSE
jgi:hypothetical protein